MAKNIKLDEVAQNFDDLDYLDEDSYLLALREAQTDNKLFNKFESSLLENPPGGSPEDSEPELEATRGGFMSPTTIDYGAQTSVLSKPTNLDKSNLHLVPTSLITPPNKDALNHVYAIDFPLTPASTHLLISFSLSVGISDAQVNQDLESKDNFDNSLANDPIGLDPIIEKGMHTETENITAADNIFWTAANQNNHYNLNFIIDISGSMNINAEPGSTRIDKAKTALVDFIELYETASENLNIHIIPFSSNENNQGAFVYTATSITDAKDFVLKQGAHTQDGLSIGMVNPNTGKEMGIGTKYDDALYHTRIALEADICDPILANYVPKVYFLSDGQPSPHHSAYIHKNWPASWSPWSTFIHDPKSEVPNSLVDNIDTFAISLGLNPSVAFALKPVASKPEYIFAIDEGLSLLNETLLQTVPEYFQGNLLANDINGLNIRITEVVFQAQDASQYIMEHNLQSVYAAPTINNQAVAIPLPATNLYVKFETPLGGMMQMNSEGHFFYLPAKLLHDAKETFDYQIQDNMTKTTDSASFEINTVSTVGIVDSLNLPKCLVMADLFDNPNHVLKLIDTTMDAPNHATSLNEIFTVTESPEKPLNLNNQNESVNAYLDNLGEIPAPNLQDGLEHIQQSIQPAFE